MPPIAAMVARRSSGTTAPATTRAPAASAWAATPGRLASYTWPGPSSSPAGTTSSPLPTTATRGRRTQRTRAWPAAGHDGHLVGADDLAREQERLAHAHVLAAAAHERPGLGRDGRPHGVPLPLLGRVLHAQDRVGALGQLAAGRDADRLARADRPGVGRAGAALAHQPQRLAARGVGRAHRVSVHRRVGEGRVVAAREHVLGQHAARQFLEGHRLGRQVEGLGPDHGQGLVEGDVAQAGRGHGADHRRRARRARTRATEATAAARASGWAAMASRRAPAAASPFSRPV